MSATATGRTLECMGIVAGIPPRGSMSARLPEGSAHPAVPADTAPVVASRPVPAGRSLEARGRRWPRALPGGIRTRILAWYVVLLMVSIAVTVVGLRQILTTQLASDIDKALAQEVEEVRRLAGGVDPTTSKPFGGDAAAILDTFFVRSVPGEYEALYAIVDGEPYKRTVAPVSLFEDPAVLAAWQAASGPTWGRTESTAGAVRWLAVPLGAGGRQAGVFAAAYYEAERRAQIDQTVQVTLALSAAVILLASALAWGAAGRAIAPLRRLTSTARGIGGRDLGARIQVEGTDEVAELTATLNSMLERLETAFTSQREFLNDVGHELRTPLTIVRGHLELLDDDPVERRQTVELMLDELDRMSRYVADLLLIARAEQPDFLRRGPVELAEFIESLAARVRPLGDRAWTVIRVRPVVIFADADRLGQAIVNLASNAVRHTSPGDVIELGAAVDGDHARLWVRDEGTGIAPEEQQRIFRRFARGRDLLTSASEGTGLGLAIVDAVVVAHGGRTELESAVGEGSRFSLVIPIEPPPEEILP
jgi:two-component system OmpR family sensor kinase